MPICIECSYPVSHLYSTYSRADDRSLGKGVRLTQCPRCQRFADKYVEHDFVVLFIDLVLIKPQVYRHLLFNRLGRVDNQFDRSIIRLGILLLLFDVYLTWARIEKSQTLSATFLSRAPIIVQYLFFLSLNALATLAHHLTVRLLASILVPTPHQPSGTENNTTTNNNGTPSETPVPSNPTTPIFPSFSMNSQAQQSNTPNIPTSSPKLTPRSSYQDNSPPPGAASSSGVDYPQSVPQGSVPHPPPPPPLRRASTAPVQTIQPLPPPSPASPAAISTALLVSSCAKLFPILLVIWGPDGSGFASNAYSQNTDTTSVPVQQTLVRDTLNGITPAATAVAAAATSAVSGSSTSVVEDWVAKLAASMPASTPGNYLANLVELMGSLLSLSAADTHMALLSNIEALYILLGCGYLRAVALAVAGQVARWTVQRVVLGGVGVG